MPRVLDVSKPSAFIQWKGTDVCLYLRCPCGELTHIDGFFVFTVACGNCGMTYKLPTVVPVLEWDDDYDRFGEWDLTDPHG